MLLRFSAILKSAKAQQHTKYLTMANRPDMILLTRYQSVPISLADACLVRMAEQYEASFILTLDSDLRIYRKNRNEIIPVIMPTED